MTEAHNEESQKSSLKSQNQSSSSHSNKDSPQDTGTTIEDMEIELANLRSLTVSDSTPEKYACFYEKVESIITSILKYLGIFIDPVPSLTNEYSQHVHQDAILRILNNPSHPFFQIFGQGPVYALLHDSKDFRDEWSYRKETSTSEARVARLMPVVEVFSSRSHALYGALEMAIACVKKEAGRNSSHKAFWDDAKWRELSLDVREQMIEKQERRLQEQESEYRAAISRKAMLDLREACQFLRERDSQCKENAIHDDAAQGEKIAELESNLRTHEARSSEQKPDLSRSKTSTPSANVNDPPSPLSSPESEITDLIQPTNQDAKNPGACVSHLSTLISQHQHRRHAQITQLIQETERTKTLFTHSTRHLSLKFNSLHPRLKTLEHTVEAQTQAAATKIFYDQQLSHWTQIIARNSDRSPSTCSRAWSAHLRKSLRDPRCTHAWTAFLHVLDELLRERESGAREYK